MAMRDDRSKRTTGDVTTPNAGGTSTADAIEERVVAFAEQLGRIVGTVQAKADGWMDREALKNQIASVRDSATDLLKQLAGRAPTAASDQSAAGSAAGASSRGRSGGVVDAPGKKHRKPTPNDPRAKMANSQAAKMRAAKPPAKTLQRRGRG